MGSEKRERKKTNQAARRAALEAARKKAEQRARVRRLVVIGAVVVVAVLGITYVSTRGGDSKVTADGGSTTSSIDDTDSSDAPTTTEASKLGTQECPKADGSSPKMTSFDGFFKDSCTDPSKTYTVTMTTDAGVITIAMDAKKAPKTVNNFVSLARYHFYDGLTFHRVVKDFVIQGGDPQGDGSGGPGYRFADELPQPGDYAAGSLAMANSGANTNGSQFFIITSDNGAKTLVSAVGGAAKYSLFGKVTAGLDVVKAIEADGPAQDGGTATKTHVMTTVTVAES